MTLSHIDQLEEHRRRLRPDFEALDEDRFRLAFPALGITFRLDHVRRERGALQGELAVECLLPGARTFDGTLSAGDFNLSGPRSRQERARQLAARAKTGEEVDWEGMLEELCQRVLAAERATRPTVSLRDVPIPEAEDDIDIDGLALLARHPACIFGDGGTLKSYLALWCAGRLAQRGLRVGFFDWELAAPDHRVRLGRLFGEDMPEIRYMRCDRPLYYMAEGIRRTVRDERLDYGVFDSIAPAADGPPETAETAAHYFQGLRRLGPIGSLHTAHISRAENADQRPFGSVFWFNLFRCCWNVKLSDGALDGAQLSIGLYDRKENLGPKRKPAGFDVTFAEGRTTFRRVNVADVPDLAGHLSVRQRMAALLIRSGQMDSKAVAEEIEADHDTVKRTARRYPKQFAVLPGGKLAMLERRSA